MLSSLGDLVVFGCDQGDAGVELCAYDGVALTLVKDIHPIGDSDPTSFFRHGDAL